MDNIAQQIKWADILIIGTALRKDGKMTQPIDPCRAKAIVAAARGK